MTELYHEDQIWLNFVAEMQNKGFLLRLRPSHVDNPIQILNIIEIPESKQGSFPVDIFMDICRKFEWKAYVEDYEALFHEQVIHFFYKEDYEMILDKTQKSLQIIRLP